MTKLAFDVGANNGKWGIDFAKRNPSIQVIAFEPVRHLVEQIKQQELPANYQIRQKGVGKTHGKATLSVSPGEASCSSLLPFRDAEKLRDVWVGREDLKCVEQYEVDVVPLSDFIEEGDVVEFLHIDAQGMDLDVLEGLGDYINQVAIGEAEAVIKPEESIYEGQKATVDSIRTFLIEKGFRVAALPHLNFLEADLRFWRTDK